MKMMMLLLVSCPQAGGGQGGRQGWRPVAKKSETSDKIFRETREGRDEGNRLEAEELKRGRIRRAKVEVKSRLTDRRQTQERLLR